MLKKKSYFSDEVVKNYRLAFLGTVAKLARAVDS